MELDAVFGERSGRIAADWLLGRFGKRMAATLLADLRLITV